MSFFGQIKQPWLDDPVLTRGSHSTGKCLGLLILTPAGRHRGRAHGTLEGLRARIRALFWDVLEELNPGVALVPSAVPGYTFCAETIGPLAHDGGSGAVLGSVAAAKVCL